MPAHSIVEWLRRRRSLTHAVWHVGEAFASTRAGARMGMHGSRARHLPHRVLVAPVDWRERMLADVSPGAEAGVAEKWDAPPSIDEWETIGDASAEYPHELAQPNAGELNDPARRRTLASPAQRAQQPTPTLQSRPAQRPTASEPSSRVVANAVVDEPAARLAQSQATGSPTNVVRAPESGARASEEAARSTSLASPGAHPSVFPPVAPPGEPALADQPTARDERIASPGQAELAATSRPRVVDRTSDTVRPDAPAPAPSHTTGNAPSVHPATDAKTIEVNAPTLSVAPPVVGGAAASRTSPPATPASTVERATATAERSARSGPAAHTPTPLRPAPGSEPIRTAPPIAAPIRVPATHSALSPADIEPRALERSRVAERDVPPADAAPAPARAEMPGAEIAETASPRLAAPQGNVHDVAALSAAPRDTSPTDRVEPTERDVESSHVRPTDAQEAPAESRDPSRAAAMRPMEERQARPPRRRPAAPPPRTADEREASTEEADQEPARAAERAVAPPRRPDPPLSEWRRLLFEATNDKPQPDARPATPPPAAPPTRPTARETQKAPATRTPVAATPLLESTRRFLRPLVGIDPASVPIVRDPRIDRPVSNAGAEAAAVGEVVALPATHDERSPRTLGLLAHELTHVAQRREPRFVPPVLRAARQNDRPGHRPAARPMPSNEETLARRVEHEVSRAAEQAPEDVPHRDPQPWGNLPAPWEPMDYASASTGFGGASSADTASVASAVSTGSAASTATTAALAASDAPVHFAEHGRAAEAGESHADAHAPSSSAAPAPDLDVLARRVYDVLKRRLAAERRREG